MDPAAPSKISRIRGWLLVVLGSFLSVAIGVIAALLASTIWSRGQSTRSHWTGSHEFTVTVFELFAAIFVFGLVAGVGGIFQLRHGRASWPAVIALLALAGVMVFLGKEIMNSPG